MNLRTGAWLAIAWCALGAPPCRTTFESARCLEDADPGAAAAARPVSGGGFNWSSAFRASQFAFVSATGSDMASSWGCLEANPLLRSRDNGGFGARGLAVKSAFAAGGLLAAHWLHRRYPKLAKPLAIALGASSGLLYGVASRNLASGCVPAAARR